MYYFNPMTEKYHFSKRKAPVAGEEINFEVNVVLDSMSALVSSDDFELVSKPFKEILKISNKLMVSVKDDEYVTLTKEDFDNLADIVKEIISFYVQIHVKDDVTGALKISKESAFIEKDKVSQIVYAVYGLLSYLNAELRISPHPRAIQDFI